MTFKEWFLLVEMSSVLKGPFTLYHGTLTGDNNSILQSFMQSGAKPIGKGLGQGGGFYVLTNPDDAKSHAIAISKNELSKATKITGQPMLVVIEVQEIDFSQWDLDIESNQGELADYIYKREKKLNKMKNVQLSPQSSDYLSTDGNTEPLAPNFELIRSNQKWGTVNLRPYANVGSPSAQKKIGIDNDYTQNAAKAALLAPYYYAHQDANPEHHKKLEALYFQTAYKDGKKIAIKYTGSSNLPIKEIYVYDGQNWTKQ